MTQPAKVQEPSMEEILASIRRIIADDEAKPPVAEKAPSPSPPPPPAAARAEKVSAAAPAPKPVMDNAAPPNAARTAAAKAAAAPPPKPKAAPAPAPAATNNQDDIDALLSGLDEATTKAEMRPSLPEPEVLELTDEMALPDPPPRTSFKKVEPQDDLEFTEAAAKPAYRPPAYEPPPFESPTVTQQILSRSTASAVETAFSSLTNTVMSNNARTIEDLVKEMLRPMLKSWLDDNLPGLVERIVKAEIERVSRGR
jgi:cell pole-organizing protein PopZ